MQPLRALRSTIRVVRRQRQLLVAGGVLGLASGVVLLWLVRDPVARLALATVGVMYLGFLTVRYVQLGQSLAQLRTEARFVHAVLAGQGASAPSEWPSSVLARTLHAATGDPSVGDPSTGDPSTGDPSWGDTSPPAAPESIVRLRPPPEFVALLLACVFVAGWTMSVLHQDAVDAALFGLVPLSGVVLIEAVRLGAYLRHHTKRAHWAQVLTRWCIEEARATTRPYRHARLYATSVPPLAALQPRSAGKETAGTA